MAKENKTIGRVPVSRHEYTDGATYYKDNIVTRYGSAFQCVVESTTTPPATIDASEKVTLGEGWIFFADTSGARNADARINDISATLDKLTSDVSAINGIANVTINVTKAEHSSTLDQIPIVGKVGDIIKVKLSEGTAVSDNTSTIVYLRKNGSEVQKQKIALNTEESITVVGDVDSIGFYIYKVTTLGTFIAEVDFVGELERLNQNQSKVEHSFNVTKAEHSSNLDTVDFSCNKGDTIRVLVSEISGKCDGDSPSIAFNDSSGEELMRVGIVLNQATDIYITKDGITKVGVYLWKVTTYGVFKISIEKTGSIVNEYLDVQNLAKNSMSGATVLTKPLILLHFSDIHSSARQLKTICAFQKKYFNRIKDSICTGDLVRENMDEDDNGVDRGFSYWMKCGAKKTVIAVGNHDYKKAGTDYSTTTSKEVYDKFLAPYIANWGVVQPENASTEGLCYFYKDYPTEKVRLIVIDANPVPNAEKNRFTESQQNWLASILESARVAEYAVVIANHYPFKYPSVATRQNNNFDCLFGGGLDNYWSVEERLAEIVDTFIGNGGKFVCHITGHAHRDMFSILEGHNKQVVISISCAYNESNGLGSDTYREDGTNSENCFNLLKIDTSAEMFTLMRIGADVDIRLRKRMSLTWDYGNKTLLHD